MVVVGLLLLSQALGFCAFASGNAREEGVANSGEEPRADGRELSYSLPPAFLSASTPQKLSAVVERLQSFGTRFAYSDRAIDAANYIESAFLALNLSVRRQEFVSNGFTQVNVLAELPGRNASLPALVLGAHYDSINGTDSLMNAYAPAPGADDDASGVAAVLSIAEAFSRAGTERTIIFGAFANEEMGRIGSREFIRQAQLQPPGIYAGLCFDMIGYNRRYPKMDMVTNQDPASQGLCGVAFEANRFNAIGLGLEKVVISDNPQNWSDQVSFWEAGLPAMYFIEDENPTQNSSYFEANPYYHTGRDTLDKLNLTLMTKVAKLGAATAAALAGLALPDFRSEVPGMPGGVFEGDNLTVSGRVYNDGAPGEYTFNVTLEVDGVPVARREAVFEVRLDLYWNATRGKHTLALVGDSDDRYLEWNETNNRFVFWYDIAVRPDLGVAGFWATDDSPVPGRPLTLVAEAVNNGGTGGEGRILIRAGDGSGGFVLDRAVTVLPGASQFIVVDTIAPSGPQNFTVEILDVAPAENQTDNNRLTITVVPDILGKDEYRIVITPDVVQTFETVSVSVEGAGPAFDWSIDFGDGHSAGWTDAPYTHFYSRAGIYFVHANLRDAKGASVELEPMPISVQDRPPVAMLDGPDTAAPGRTLDFSASRSFDQDGVVVQYLWDFGEGAREFGPGARRSFASERTYPVRLTVTDDRGQTNTTLLNVNIVNLPPKAKAAASPRLLFTGEAANLNGTASSDPDGAVVSYLWDFGDNTNATGPIASHAYSKAGTYIVTLTVTDNGGGTASTSLSITVLKKLKPLEARAKSGSPVIIPAMLLVLLLIAFVLVLRGRPVPGKEEEE